MEMGPGALDAASLEVLALLYRARPADVAALRGLLPTDLLPRLDAALEAIASAGFVAREGDALRIESPYSTFLGYQRDRVAAVADEAASTIAFIRALPVLIRNWDLGEVDPDENHPLAARVFHGRSARVSFWRDHLLGSEAASPSWVLPDLDVTREVLERGELPTGRLEAARMLVPPIAADDDDRHALLAGARRLGAEVRMLEGLPSWFFVEPGLLVAMPVWWGEHQPSSVLVVRTPPIVAAFELLFEQHWTRGEPAHDEAPAWEPVLRLLAQGLTDEAIARTLGQDARTVRRRIAEAMADHGCSSRFALGVAWAERSGGS